MRAQMTEDKMRLCIKKKEVRVTAELFFAFCHLDSRCSVFNVKVAGLASERNSRLS